MCDFEVVDPGLESSPMELLLLFDTYLDILQSQISTVQSTYQSFSRTSAMLRSSLPRNLRAIKSAPRSLEVSTRGYKDIAFGHAARQKMSNGIEVLAKAVSATLGPK